MQKAQLQQVVNECGHEVDLDMLVDRLYLLEELEESEKQIAAGQVIPHEEVKRRLAKWLE